MKVYSKVKSMSRAGAIVAVLAWALSYFANVVMPPEIVSALILVVAWIAGYFTPEVVGHG